LVSGAEKSAVEPSTILVLAIQVMPPYGHRRLGAPETCAGIARPS
jgi:hypothetical protein